ncbi:MAG: response regulator [Enhydrobacter sp.]|nr:MAG: response regulator [Enhydrobacter sp.]
MRKPPLVLVADDMPANVEILQMRLQSRGYEVAVAADGNSALAGIVDLKPDLILLDIMMPGIDGIEVCRRVRADPSLPYMPIVMVTAKTDKKDVAAGLDAGADDYLPKPFDHAELMARVRSMLRIKELYDELTELNADLELRVRDQVQRIERLGRLRRFLPPQVADLMLAKGEAVLDSHRREIVVAFCDLRGFTTFSETAEPEDVMSLLNTYHSTLGPIMQKHGATVDRFAGDGAILYFNDPLPVPDAPQRAIRMAAEMRAQMAGLCHGWRRRGDELGFGVGIAQGHATLGRIGFEARSDYTAIGSVMNLAARLSDAAADGEILVTRRLAVACDGIAEFDEERPRELKGFSRPVPVSNLRSLKA